MKEYYTPNEFDRGSDSERIQSAINAAEKSGCGKIVIPGYNEKSDSMLWVIDKTILIPSDMTIILDNCHLVMADGVMCRMFENSNVGLPVGRTLEGEQKNIRIIGVGNAVLDGGKDNGLTEYTCGKNGMPSIMENVTIFLCNVSDFVIENITVVDQRWWAFDLLFARRGKISDIRFRIDTPCEYGNWRNQDGIDLRVGCNNILIQNISGEVGDDCVALTALMNPAGGEYALRVEGKETDIHDVIIRDVRAVTSLCATIRLLNQYGHKIYNISIDNVVDVSKPVLESKTQKVIRIGEYNYFGGIEENKTKPGDMYNISISNVYSRAMTAIHLEMAVKNLHVNNVYVHSDGQYAVTFGQWNVHDVIFMYKPELWDKQKNKVLHPDGEETGLIAENVLIENVYYTAKNEAEGFVPAVCAVHKSEFKNVVIRNVNNDTESKTVYCTDGLVPDGLTFI